MFLIFTYVQIAFCRVIQHEDIEYYTIHPSQLSTIFTIPDAQSIAITQLQNQSICEAKQQTVDTQVLNYEQCNDILLALLQLDPLNYLIFNSEGKLIFSADQITYNHTFDQAMGNQIQMIKLEQDVLLISNDAAYLIEIDTLKSYSITYRQVTSWTKREYRKMTKLISMGKQEYLLSAVGKDGMELYRIQNRTIELIRQFQAYNNVVDFAEVNNNLFLLDSEKGLFLCKVDVQQLTTQISQIDNVQGGIAVDSFNGVNVFVAYKWARHAVVEYIVNTTSAYWYKHSMMYTQKIYDVDALENFAIIQGQYQHLVLFNFHMPNVKSYFKHFRLTDFSVFYLNGQTYFSGITPKSYVFSEINYSPAKVTCITPATDEVFDYNLIYTIKVGKKYETHSKQFQVQVIDTYIYKESLIFVVLIGSGGVIFILFVLISLLWKNRELNKQVLLLESAVVKKQGQQVIEPPPILNSNLMSMRESKDVEYLNVKQV